MKKTLDATRVAPQAARGPLFSLASAWRAAEDLGGRPSAPAPTNRLLFDPLSHPPRRLDDRGNR